MDKLNDKEFEIRTRWAAEKLQFIGDVDLLLKVIDEARAKYEYLDVLRNQKDKAIDILHSQISILQTANKALQARVEKLERAIKHAYEFCLCERNEPVGFDYGEKHPRMGKPGMGKRWTTPRVFIELCELAPPEGGCREGA